MTRLTKRTN